MVDDQPHTKFAVFIYKRELTWGFCTTKGNKWEANLAKIIYSRILTAGAHNDETIYCPCLCFVLVSTQLLVARRTGGYKNIVTQGSCLVADTCEKFAEERISKSWTIGRDDQTDGICFLFLQLAFP